MPVYEFVCDCDYQQNYYLHMDERNRSIKCPKCGKKLKKLIGKGSCFNLRGQGFYKEGLQ